MARDTHTDKVGYKQQDGTNHRHKLCNHCTDCGEPLLASYCLWHEPSWSLYVHKRILAVISKVVVYIKLRFTGSEQL